ncbi:hypothetical protein C8046_09135 [Serinibacter arcticus]|uniref:Uncharacterized protein n=1 Tax=Serinibacter arcticus TaxID=1655435 RepID=A0A2U1ZUX2_9MICO|nr:hypothetical protein [Serinibacter arcticus]PWD50786.1 hypothetical protein C8046_09135 [Serinibacter arcticus]
MEETTEALLAGPRARRLLAELIEIRQVDGWSVTAMSSLPTDRTELARRVRARAAERAAPLAALTAVDPRVLAAIDAATVMNMPWQPPDENDQLLADPAIVAALRPAAEALAAAEMTRGWHAPLAVGKQRLTLFDLPDWEGVPPAADRPLEVTGLDAWGAAWRRAVAGSAWNRVDWTTPVDEHSSGPWWSAPIGPWWNGEEPRRPGGAPVTTPPLNPETDHLVGSAGLVWLEDSPGADEALLVPVSPSRPPRIYEVTGPEAWAALVRHFPADVSASRRSDWYRHTGRDGAWAVPDWAAVRESYDAVHVTVAGYLTTAGLAVEVGDGVATVLAGWAPEATAWLTDVLVEDGPRERWRLDRTVRRDADHGWRLETENDGQPGRDRRVRRG